MSPTNQVDSLKDTGLTVLYEPEQPQKPLADIVFVHGLQGHPVRTWKCDSSFSQRKDTTPSNPPPRRSRWKWPNKPDSKEASPATASENTAQHAPYWPHDFLRRDYPNSRILTWGYDSNITNLFHGSANKNHISAHSRDLLADLKGKRGGCQSRPLIFVAHSLGGIIVKKMLIVSHDADHEIDKSLCKSTKAILFFGTPHRGSDFSDSGERARRGVSMMGFDTAKQNVNALQIDSEMLEDCHQRFLKLLGSHKLDVHTFQEAHGATPVGYARLNRKVVPNVSTSCIHTEYTYSINANHMNMCKFSNRDDAGYQRVTAALSGLFNNLGKVISTAAEEEPAIEEDEIEELSKSDLACLDSLRFQEMDYRHQDIQKAYRDSCTWIFHHGSYIRWQENGRGLLWLEGDPGSGKSTLMKRILESFEPKKASGEVLLQFFFHRRGDPLQYTQVGMLRTILHQLLSQVPSIRAGFKGRWAEKVRLEGKEGANVEWRFEELRGIFKSLLLTATEKRTVRIFIDALDEAGELSAQQLISYFHELNEEPGMGIAPMSICFSCRKYPVFPTHLGLEVCVDRENAEDIAAYIHAELDRQLVRRTSNQNDLDELQTQISNKASGVFLWAVLMIPVVAKQYNDGEDLDSIHRKLDEVPSDLGEIYQHILTKVVDVDKRPRTLLLMQWIFLAYEPLSVSELREAMASDDSAVRPSQNSIQESKGFVRDDTQMKRLIVSLSGGLAEVDNHGGRVGSGPVQFIHESVNDFLRKDNFESLGLCTSADPVGLGHSRLCFSCLNYFKLKEVSSINLDEQNIPEIKKSFPFSKYATNLLFWHAEQAENRGSSLQELLPRFEWPSETLIQKWINLCFRHLQEDIRTRKLPVQRLIRNGFLGTGATLLHVAAASSLASAVRALLENEANVDSLTSKGLTALHCTSARIYGGVKNEECVHLLLDYRANINARAETYDTPLRAACQFQNIPVVRLLLDRGAEINLIGGHYGTALQAAAALGIEGVVRLLLDRGAEINLIGGYSGTALQAAAARRENEGVVRLLLYRGAETNLIGGYYGTALQTAATWRKNKGVVRLLLDRGAEINSIGGHYGTALQAAAALGIEGVVRLLLDRGAETNLISGHYGTALQAAAAQREHEGVVRLLLDRGAEINLIGGHYGTALQAAAALGIEGVVRLLLDRGAEINLIGGEYGTALQAAAARSGNGDTIRLLLDRGAEINLIGGRYGTALQAAAARRDEGVVRLLLKAGAGIEARHGIDDELFEVAKNSWRDSEAKVNLLLTWKYGRRWFSNCDTMSEKVSRNGSESSLRSLLRARTLEHLNTRTGGQLLQFARDSEIDSEAKVRTLLGWKYGRRWFNIWDAIPEKVARAGSGSSLRTLLKTRTVEHLTIKRGVQLLPLARESEIDSEAKVRMLLGWKYGRRWFNIWDAIPEKVARAGSGSSLQTLLKTRTVEHLTIKRRVQLLPLAMKSEIDSSAKQDLLFRWENWELGGSASSY